MTSFHLIIAVAGLLTTLGLIMVLSASGVRSYDADGSAWVIFGKQVLWTVIGLVACYVSLRMSVRFIRRVAFTGYVVTVILLVLVLVPGHRQPGQRLAQVVRRRRLLDAAVRAGQDRLRHLGRASAGGPPAGAGLAARDADPAGAGRGHRAGADRGPARPRADGVAGHHPAGAAVVRRAAAARLRHLAAGGLHGRRGPGDVRGLPLRPGAVLDEPRERPQDTGYQARQAKFALAHGGIFGDGLGQGVAKWNYLPNAHNDFIFAIIGEELGFVGAFGLLVLFGLFAYTGMRIARRSADPFLRLLTATTTMWVLGQAFINIGYVIGILPVTGIQLPLISAGGTSTAATLFMIGIMANAARHEPEAVAALRAGRDDKVNRFLRLPLPEPYVPTRLEIVPRPQARRPAAGQGRPVPQRHAEGCPGARPQGLPQRRGTAAAGVLPHSRPADPPGRCIMDLASGRRRPASGAARSRTGRSALRVNDTVSKPAGGLGASPSPAGAALSSLRL